jgi:hypothetical protein
MKVSVFRRQKGMVLVIVIAAIILMSIATLGILSRNVSQSMGDEKEIQRIQAELLTKGCFWRLYQNNGIDPGNCSGTINNRAYTVTYTINAGQVDTQIAY